MTYLLCVIFGIFVGIAITLFAWISYDKVQENKRIDQMFNPEEWCIEHCKLYEECHSNHEDPDDAMDELVNKYCIDCPISKATDFITDVNLERWKKKHGNKNA